MAGNSKDSRCFMKPELKPELAEELSDIPQPSPVARAVSRLKSASMQAARERETLPQPLFWSLFHSQLADIKKLKQQKGLIDALIGFRRGL